MPKGIETESIIPGQGTLSTWNLWSPRLGVTTKLTADGRTLLRGSYGRFSQGVLTGEFSSFHPGVSTISTRTFEQSTGGYTRFESDVSSKNLLLNPDTRAPHTDEYSVGMDREVGRQLAVAIAYVHKSGTDFVGWTDVEFFKRVRANTGTPGPPLSANGIDFDRPPAPDERAALLAYLRKP